MTNKLRYWPYLISAVTVTLLQAQEQTLQKHSAESSSSLTEEDQKTLYAFGLSLAQSATRFSLSAAELDVVVRGLTDGVQKHPKLDVNEYATKVSALGDARLGALAEIERSQGSELRARVLLEPGALLKESGLIIVPVKQGTGKVPTTTDTVLIEYTGSLRDGTVFDSTQQDGPLKVPLSKAAVPCLSEGLQLMKAGEHSRLFCPPQLFRGMIHPLITPGSTLIYDVTLLRVFE